jgi:hypothetical protein
MDGPEKTPTPAAEPAALFLFALLIALAAAGGGLVCRPAPPSRPDENETRCHIVSTRRPDMEELERIKTLVLAIDPNIPEDDLEVVVPTIAAREDHLRDMSEASPGSAEWLAAAERVDACEALMSNFGLLVAEADR